MVHTGPNIQPGGLKNGFTKAGYHACKELKVKTELTSPTPSHNKTNNNILKSLFTLNIISGKSNCVNFEANLLRGIDDVRIYFLKWI